MTYSGNVTSSSDTSNLHTAVDLLATTGFEPVVIQSDDPRLDADGAMSVTLADGVVGKTSKAVLYDLSRRIFWIVTGKSPEFKRFAFGNSLAELTMIFDVIEGCDPQETAMSREFIGEMRALLAKADRKLTELEDLTGGALGQQASHFDGSDLQHLMRPLPKHEGRH